MIINQTSYYPGGTNFNTIQTQYGLPAANQVYAAALTGDNVLLNKTISDVSALARQGDTNIESSELQTRAGSFDNRGLTKVLYDQVTENPLDAPLDAANKVIKNTVISAIGNPFITLTLIVGAVAVGAGVYFYFGGKLPSKA